MATDLVDQFGRLSITVVGHTCRIFPVRGRDSWGGDNCGGHVGHARGPDCRGLSAVAVRSPHRAFHRRPASREQFAARIANQRKRRIPNWPRVAGVLHIDNGDSSIGPVSVLACPANRSRACVITRSGIVYGSCRIRRRWNSADCHRVEIAWRIECRGTSRSVRPTCGRWEARLSAQSGHGASRPLRRRARAAEAAERVRTSDPFSDSYQQSAVHGKRRAFR